jgi:uncharacterized protein involved in exopolysaccharide biosynthesis
MNKGPGTPTPAVESHDASAAERVICVVARDVLSLDRHHDDSGAFTAIVWKGRWLVIACVAACALVAVAYGFLATEWYTAEVVLTPAGAKSTQQGLSSQLEGLGMLTGLAAGLGLGSGRTAEPIGVLKSRDFARQFIDEHGLLHVLLADKWDARKGRWKETDPKLQPDIRDAIEYFDKNVLQVDEDKKTGLVDVSIRWKDSALAASWANMVVDRLNDQMRSRALAESEANVSYLEKVLAETNVVEVKFAISRLLETELQKTMVARGDKQYAFRIVDHADVPKRRSWPKRRVVLAIGILAGGVLGLAAVLIRERFTRRSLNGV